MVIINGIGVKKGLMDVDGEDILKRRLDNAVSIPTAFDKALSVLLFFNSQNLFCGLDCCTWDSVQDS